MTVMPDRRYIELDVTYTCSAACAHCCFACSPKKGGLMPVDDARVYLTEAKKLGLTGREVILTGGEALLFYEHTLAIVRAAAHLGMVPLWSIQSNASWCTTDVLTRARLVALREAGLGGMYFSVDPFHQQFVPIDRVRRGVRIAEEVFGADDVAVSGRECLNADAMPTVDEVLAARTDSPYAMVARAARTLADRYPTAPLEQILEMDCRGGNRDIDPSSVWQIKAGRDRQGFEACERRISGAPYRKRHPSGLPERGPHV